jgi:hypothetical protein
MPRRTANKTDAPTGRPKGSSNASAKGKSKSTSTSKRKAVKTKTTRARSAPAGRLAKRGAGARRGAARPPQTRVAVKSLDSLEKCGPNTSVQFLYRVDESTEGRSTPHLVFFDHHGWYCEHGRTCPAVGHAKKYNGQIARVS